MDMELFRKVCLAFLIVTMQPGFSAMAPKVRVDAKKALIK